MKVCSWIREMRRCFSNWDGYISMIPLVPHSSPGNTANSTCLALRCRVSLNSVPNPGSPWKLQSNFCVCKPKHGFCVWTRWWIWSTRTCLCGLWWVSWENANMNVFRFGSTVIAVDAGDLTENQGFLALLLICYMIYLTFCFASMPLILLPT